MFLSRYSRRSRAPDARAVAACTLPAPLRLVRRGMLTPKLSMLSWLRIGLREPAVLNPKSPSNWLSCRVYPAESVTSGLASALARSTPDACCSSSSRAVLRSERFSSASLFKASRSIGVGAGMSASGIGVFRSSPTRRRNSSSAEVRRPCALLRETSARLISTLRRLASS